MQPHDSIKLCRLSKQGIFEKAAPLYEKGASLRAIARELDIPKTTVRLDAGKVLESVALSQTKYCSVSAMVSRAVPISYTVELNGEKIGAGRADFKGS